VHFETIPVANPDATNNAGQSIVALDPPAVHQFVASLVHPDSHSSTPPPPVGPNPASITVNVSNATSTGGLASQVSTALAKAGYAQGSVGNSRTSQQDSAVLAASAGDLGATEVAKELGGLPVRADASVAPGAVSVIIGSSYSGPGSTSGTSTAPSSTPVATTPPAPPITAGDGVPCIN